MCSREDNWMWDGENAAVHLLVINDRQWVQCVCIDSIESGAATVRELWCWGLHNSTLWRKNCLARGALARRKAQVADLVAARPVMILK